MDTFETVKELIRSARRTSGKCDRLDAEEFIALSIFHRCPLSLLGYRMRD